MGNDASGQWTEECHKTGNACGDHHHEGDGGDGGTDSLVQNVMGIQQFIELCGCKDQEPTEEGWDEHGFMHDGNDSAHCPTVCWVEKNILNYLYKHVFVIVGGEDGGDGSGDGSDDGSGSGSP